MNSQKKKRGEEEEREGLAPPLLTTLLPPSFRKFKNTWTTQSRNLFFFSFFFLLPCESRNEKKKKKSFFRNDPSAGSPTERIWLPVLCIHQGTKLELSVARISSSNFLLPATLLSKRGRLYVKLMFISKQSPPPLQSVNLPPNARCLGCGLSNPLGFLPSSRALPHLLTLWVVFLSFIAAVPKGSKEIPAIWESSSTFVTELLYDVAACISVWIFILSRVRAPFRAAKAYRFWWTCGSSVSNKNTKCYGNLVTTFTSSKWSS